MAGQIATTGGAGLERNAPGSISALVALYYTSADYKLLAAATQRTYRGIIDRFRADHGDKPVSKLRAEDVRRMVDARADKPAAATNFLRMVRLLMAFAVERGWRSDNPASEVKSPRYQTDGFHSWTLAEVESYEKHWPLGTKQRLALDLLLYTAQRSWDVRSIGPQHRRNDHLSFRQHKTGRAMEIPLHPNLIASLDASPTAHLTYLVTQHGAPYSEKGFSNFVSTAAQAAGLPIGCSAHGLRKAAATRMAESGCSASEIQSFTGHVTLKEVERYTRSADQKRRAGNALAKVIGTSQEQNLSNQTEGLDNSGRNTLKG